MKKATIVILMSLTISFTSAQNIKSFINYVFYLPLTERQAAMDSIMEDLESHGFPYTHHDTACFIFKGDANTVQLAGGFTNWQWDPITMYNIIGTDFWYNYRTFAMNARLAYKYIIDESNWILDPLNPNTVVGGFGPDSELAMPEYIIPWEVEEITGAPAGTKDTFSISSSHTGSKYLCAVYLPYNYNQNRTNAYPVAYFQDGYTYFYAGRTYIVFDNLINAEIIDTIIGVFIRPNNRDQEYVGLMRYHYQKFFVEELIPYVDEKYNTIQKPSGRAVCGNSYGGNISALLSCNYPEIFGNCGMQAGAIKNNNNEVFKLVESGPTQNVRWASVWGYYDYFNDLLLGFNDLLISKDYELHWSTHPEGHNMGLCIATLDELLSFFFPPGFSYITERKNNILSELKVSPNPCKEYTDIQYYLKASAGIQINIYNNLGKLVHRFEKEKSQGFQKISWYPGNLPSGIYYVNLIAGRQATSTKLLLIK